MSSGRQIRIQQTLGGLVGSLQLSEDVSGGVCVIRASGYLDFDMAPRLKQCMVRCIEAGHATILVDLAHVGFIDSTAIGVLVGALKRQEEANGYLAVLCNNDNVRGIFELIGLDSVIPLFDSYEEAVVAVPQVA